MRNNDRVRVYIRLCTLGLMGMSLNVIYYSTVSNRVELL